jgi:transposase
MVIMKKVLTEILNLPGIIVEDYQKTEETIILSVKNNQKTAVCPRCGKTSHRLHQNKKRLIKDLPMGDKEVFLRINRRRFKCENCQKPFSEVLNFVGNRQNFTDRYGEKVVEQILNSDLKNVAQNNKLKEEQVWSMLMYVAAKILPINLKSLDKLGIDEISLVKGQGKFIVVLVDLKTHKLIGLVSERKQSKIKEVMIQWGEEILSQIKEVSIDMTGNYKHLIKKICPNAEITVDRFHVTRIIHQELNQARIEQKKGAEALNAQARNKLFDGLKGSKFLLLKSADNLSEKQKNKLKLVKEASPLIATMYELKEEFHNLFENSQNLGIGTLNLIDWLKKAEPYYQKSVKTIKRWLSEIVGYFEARTTTGIVEGINNKLKLLKRSGFGFRNFHNFEIRALLSWHFPKNLAH